MRYKKLLSAMMSAVMVLSGCNADTSADKPVVTSAVTDEVTTTTTTTAGVTTTVASTTTVTTSAAPETAFLNTSSPRDYCEDIRSSMPVLKRERAVKQLDAIEASDHSSDDMNAVIGKLLAGNNIAWAACQDRDVREYLKDTEGVRVLFDRIYTRECADSLFDKFGFSDDGNSGYRVDGTAEPYDMTNNDNYFKITEVGEDDCTFLFFCCMNGLITDDYAKPDMDYYTVYEETAVRENGVWKLTEAIHLTHKSSLALAECNKQDLVTRMTQYAHSSRKAEKQIEEDYSCFIRDYALGVWQLENTDKLYVSGINDSYSSYEYPISIQFGDRPVMVYIDDEIAEMYLSTDYVADLIRMTVYANEPDVLIVEDLFGSYDGEKYITSTEKYIRIDTAGMYPETGIVTRYIHERLYTRWMNTYRDYAELECDGIMYNNDFFYRADGANRELTFIEDNGDSLVFTSLFHCADDLNAPAEKRFRYEMHRTDDGWWELGDFEDMKDDTLAYLSKEFYDYSDHYTLHIPANCTDPDVGALINELTNTAIELDPDNTFFTLKDGCLFSIDMTVLYAAPYDAEDPYPYDEPTAPVTAKIYTVPESVTYIAPHAFYKKGSARTLDVIYAGEKITDENIAALDLYYMTEVWFSQTTRALIGTNPRRGGV